jgi:hypothetical protein
MMALMRCANEPGVDPHLAHIAQQDAQTDLGDLLRIPIDGAVIDGPKLMDPEPILRAEASLLAAEKSDDTTVAATNTGWPRFTSRAQR